MKNVSEVLAKRLKRLETPFSRDWIADFSSLMEFIQTNPSTAQILESIKEQKEDAQASLSQNLEQLLKEGATCLKAIQKTIGRKHVVSHSIDELLKTRIDLEKIESPFFELESVYHKYYAGFVSLLRILAQEDTNVFISKYCVLSCIKLQDTVHLNIDLTFSPYLQKCKQDIEILSGTQATSIWGKWDTLLKWTEWTKNGISPSNHAFQSNLQNLFIGMRIDQAIQSCGLFFLEHLANKTTVTTDKEACLKAVELYVDEKDQYWIILHFSGENRDRKEFFIKKLQQEARPYELLMLLLKSEPYSNIEFSNRSHTLVELEIKRELKKLFFPKDKFAGMFVRLGEMDREIDVGAIMKHLQSIISQRKNLPSFNNLEYCNYHSTLSTLFPI